MRTSTSTVLLLASTFTLTLAAGCDEAPKVGLDDFGDDVDFRCPTSNCTNPPINNTSKIGDHPISNMSETFGADVANESAAIRIVSGLTWYSGNQWPITQIDVEPDGELVLKIAPTSSPAPVWIRGDGVQGTKLYITVTPNNPNQQAMNAVLLIADAQCERGLEDISMSICRYEFVTNVVPDDEELYPEHAEYGNYYHICPDSDEGGLWPESYKFSSVLSPNVVLNVADITAPSIDLASGKFINGCINGAVSKGQFLLNAFYDSTAYRGLHPSQRTAMLKMWTAWFGGTSRTVPGKLISPHDPIGGLFTWDENGGWDIEAGYGASGASCRGPGWGQGAHRHYANPVTTLTGWSSLPVCGDEATLETYATLGVKVPSDAW